MLTGTKLRLSLFNYGGECLSFLSLIRSFSHDASTLPLLKLINQRFLLNSLFRDKKELVNVVIRRQGER